MTGSRFFASCLFGAGLILIGIAFRLDATESGKPTEPLELIHADLLRGEVRQNEPVRILQGNVYFRQGVAEMRCNQALHYTESERVVFMGQVRIDKEKFSLQADEITYLAALSQYIAIGNVRLRDSTRTLASRRMTFEEEEATAYASGDVCLTDHAESMQLIGEEGEYRRREGYAKVVGKPMFTRIDTTKQDTLWVLGRNVEMFDSGERVQVSDSVQIWQKDLLASCDRMLYSDSLQTITLFGDPRSSRLDQLINGDTILLFLSGTEIAKIDIVEHARVSSFIDSLNVTQLLTGNRVEIFITDQAVDTVRISGQATSFYYVVEEGDLQGLNRVIADELLLLFNADELDQVVMRSDPGVSEGVFYPIDSAVTHKIESEMDEIVITIRKPKMGIHP